MHLEAGEAVGQQVEALQLFVQPLLLQVVLQGLLLPLPAPHAMYSTVAARLGHNTKVVLISTPPLRDQRKAFVIVWELM